MALPRGAVGQVGLQCVIVVLPDHTHFLIIADADAYGVSMAFAGGPIMA